MSTLSSAAIASLLERVRQRLQHHLALPIRPQAAGRAEAQVWQIGSAIQLVVTAPAPGLVPASSQEEKSCPTLFVYDYVPGQLGSQLRAQGTCYADAAGNAWLRHPALVVSVQGCVPPRTGELVLSSPTRHVQLLRLLFQLVLRPELASYSVANMATHTQLPLEEVRQVLHTLAAYGYWDKSAPLGTSPLLLPTPLHYWLAHYPSILRRRLNAQRYRFRQPSMLAYWWQHALPAGCLWGGEAAAHLLLARATAPTYLTLHSHLPRAQVVRQLDLLPDSKGPLEVVNAFVPATYFAPTDPRCVPPLLVYADLLASSRPTNEQLAEEVRSQYLTDLLG